MHCMRDRDYRAGGLTCTRLGDRGRENTRRTVGEFLAPEFGRDTRCGHQLGKYAQLLLHRLKFCDRAAEL